VSKTYSLESVGVQNGQDKESEQVEESTLCLSSNSTRDYSNTTSKLQRASALILSYRISSMSQLVPPSAVPCPSSGHFISMS